MCQGGKPDTAKLHSSYIGMNVCGSAYENGCVVEQCVCYYSSRLCIIIIIGTCKLHVVTVCVLNEEPLYLVIKRRGNHSRKTRSVFSLLT